MCTPPAQTDAHDTLAVRAATVAYQCFCVKPSNRSIWWGGGSLSPLRLPPLRLALNANVIISATAWKSVSSPERLRSLLLTHVHYAEVISRHRRHQVAASSSSSCYLRITNGARVYFKIAIYSFRGIKYGFLAFATLNCRHWITGHVLFILGDELKLWEPRS